MLRLADHLKTQINKLNTDFDEQIKAIWKSRGRDKSDNDILMQQHTDGIHDAKITTNRH